MFKILRIMEIFIEIYKKYFEGKFGGKKILGKIYINICIFLVLKILFIFLIVNIMIKCY